MFKGRQAFLAVAMENKKVALIAEDGGQNNEFFLIRWKAHMA